MAASFSYVLGLGEVSPCQFLLLGDKDVLCTVVRSEESRLRHSQDKSAASAMELAAEVQAIPLRQSSIDTRWRTTCYNFALPTSATCLHLRPRLYSGCALHVKHRNPAIIAVIIEAIARVKIISPIPAILCPALNFQDAYS
ncbi:hypothetical protein CCM_00650 [Cordyceps militaris CM01]|uniref:Uncharacterized protein n=1 Tax=Cordyceps militaris (strain CM01) TaxID=983644 RepID=G3J581_CORMM|nr:uncharacterized protein CCM_00650 [Cordyceps militaris CM01]EGX95995.1 hypothetical protein CCM_00650 [Cordyceps militaris CM01]